MKQSYKKIRFHIGILPKEKQKERTCTQNHPVKIDKLIISKNDNKTSDNLLKNRAFIIKKHFFPAFMDRWILLYSFLLIRFF